MVGDKGNLLNEALEESQRHRFATLCSSPAEPAFEKTGQCRGSVLMTCMHPSLRQRQLVKDSPRHSPSFTAGNCSVTVPGP